MIESLIWGTKDDVGKDGFYWWMRSNTISEMRSSVINEIDKINDLKLSENKVDVYV